MALIAEQGFADDLEPDLLRQQIDPLIGNLMQQQAIKGMAVAIVSGNQQHYFNYGVANADTGEPVTRDTLFEIGSLSKVFTATLGAQAHALGKLALDAPASRYLPALRGTPVGDASVLELGTYSAGCLPLQFPNNVETGTQALAFYQQWQPRQAQGIVRCYSNPSLGLFGELAARSQQQAFASLMTQALLPQLGLKHTYLKVPASEQARYAQGYDAQAQPVRVNPGPLSDEAYGVVTSAADLLRFVRLNLQPQSLPPPLQQAIATTQRGYFKVGEMTQGLGWERYAYPVDLVVLQRGNSADMALKPQAAERLTPAQPPLRQAWYNKTGATNGFGAYVAFVPDRGLGIVLLANKNYPNSERVRVAHEILSALDR